MDEMRYAESRGHDGGEAGPTLEQIAEALERHASADGLMHAGVAGEIEAETGWDGRRLDVLGVLTEDTARMGYLAGGRKPAEVMTWLPQWVDSPLTVEQIRTIVTSAGWSPEPFAVVVRNGLLERLVHSPDGSPRRIRGELAGAWLSDMFVSAGDEEILAAVRTVVQDDEP